jgi:hypothetical protein
MAKWTHYQTFPIQFLYDTFYKYQVLENKSGYEYEQDLIL